jgi:hypothetical protein
MVGELHVPTKLSGEGGTSHTDWPAGTKLTGPLGVLVAGTTVSVGGNVGASVSVGANASVEANVALGSAVAVGTVVAEAATVLTAGGGKVAVGAGVVAGAQAANTLISKAKKTARNLSLQFSFGLNGTAPQGLPCTQGGLQPERA